MPWHPVGTPSSGVGYPAPQARPLAAQPIPAGFPSPAEDYMERELDLAEYVVRNPAATFYLRVRGHSMRDAGIFDDDIVVVDRSLRPRDGSVVVAILDGEFTLKRLRLRLRSSDRPPAESLIVLEAAHPDYPDIPVSSERDFEVWGVATFVLHGLT